MMSRTVSAMQPTHKHYGYPKLQARLYSRVAVNIIDACRALQPTSIQTVFALPYAQFSCVTATQTTSKLLLTHIPPSALDVHSTSALTAYIAHGTFEWRKLSTAAGAARAYKAGHTNQKVTGRVHRIKTPVLQMLAEQQIKLQSKQATTQSSQAKSDAQQTPSAKPSSGADATKKVSHPWKTESGSRAFAEIAAVDSLKHLWPSSKDETGMWARANAKSKYWHAHHTTFLLHLVAMYQSFAILLFVF